MKSNNLKELIRELTQGLAIQLQSDPDCTEKQEKLAAHLWQMLKKSSYDNETNQTAQDEHWFLNELKNL